MLFCPNFLLTVQGWRRQKVSHGERPVRPYVFVDYSDPASGDVPYDPRYPDVARRIAGMVEAVLPDGEIEHIGSTAIPECAGKGVVDMMVMYPEGAVAAARQAVERLGFQLFLSREPFPPERPVFVGMVEHDGEMFRSHVHLMPPGWPEIDTQRRFRDRLSADPALVAEYVALKRAVLTAGVADSGDYNEGKNAFIKEVINGER